MKATEADKELAMRFPDKADIYGFAASMADARVNPQQLARLLKLGLIKASRSNSAFPSPTARSGVGNFFRQTEHYIRTFKETL